MDINRSVDHPNEAQNMQQVGNVVKFRPGFRAGFHIPGQPGRDLGEARGGTITRFSGVGDLEIMLDNGRIIKGISPGCVEVIS